MLPGLAESVLDPVLTNGDATSHFDGPLRIHAITQQLCRQLRLCAVGDAHVDPCLPHYVHVQRTMRTPVA